MQLSGLGLSCFISTLGFSQGEALEPEAKGKQASAARRERVGQAEEMPCEGPGPRGDLTVPSLSFPICTIGTVVLAYWAGGQFGGLCLASTSA